MNGGTEQKMLDQLFAGLRGTFLEGQLILGGSSGLLAFPTNAPAYTEDLDFYLSEELAITRGAEIVSLLADAQMAFLALRKDPTFRDHGAERYASCLGELESGYRTLVEIVKEALDD